MTLSPRGTRLPCALGRVADGPPIPECGGSSSTKHNHGQAGAIGSTGGTRGPGGALRVGLVGLMVAAVLVGCGTNPGSTSGEAAASFNPETALTDPKGYVGPSTATVGDQAIVPIAENPKPSLPVTVTDVQGAEVTVTDISRILA
ncbi:MAG: hypothetical protein LBH68_00205, partial [Bifidobacteriaceae bacterium]|nr:hypothetical protein [Bifidobacteriaceae bacterium]